MWDSFDNDIVNITKSDGAIVRENVPADVQSGLIFIHDPSVPIAPGYEISRVVPSGLTEVYVVVDPGFCQAFGAIEAHYQVKVRRKEAIQGASSVVNYNLTGANPRVNIGSYDASHNVVFHSGDHRELFDRIRDAVQDGVTDLKERDSVLEAVSAMEHAVGAPTFIEQYTRFVGIIADHITLITPFIPALTQLISQRAG
jgi:hypothetical protein